MKAGLILAGILTLCTSISSHAGDPQSPLKVACVGNSITYGMTLANPATDSYPAQLQPLLGDKYRVERFGRNGATLLRKGHRPYVADPIFTEALAFSPDILVVHLGVNDTDPRNFPHYGDDFAPDYLALIDSFRVRNPNVRVIMANLSPILSQHYRYRSGTRAWRDSLRILIPQIAKSAGAETVDFGEALRDYPNLIPDGIHPNKEGASHLARAVYSRITGDYGGLQLPEIYGDGMVLQRFRPLKIRGTADAEDTIDVRIGAYKARATADSHGRWSVTLPPMGEAFGLTMTVAAAGDTLQFNDVAIGEVWLASGQSNMEFHMNRTTTYAEDKAITADTLLRLFDMKPVAYTDKTLWNENQIRATDGLRHYKPSRWLRSTEETAEDFSAVAWHFGKMLRDSLKVPVGIISNPIGGSPAEAWVDIETLEHNIPEILIDWRNNDYLQPWVQQRVRENVGADTLRHRHPYEPSYLYAAGIRPLGGFPVAGIIWYQGESNAHNTEVHESVFQSLVESWRRTWESPGLPFIFVQLSSINRPSWPAFRNSQRLLAHSIPNVWMAVSSDLGVPDDVHPANKRPIGRRLALQALNHVYSMTNVVPQGPEIDKATAVGNKVTLSFDFADGLTTADGLTPATFEIAEYDGIYFPADCVTITDNNEITISSMKVDNPCFVRYGWQPYTEANLVNGAGLPASTFKIRIEGQPDQEPGRESGVSGAFTGAIDGILIQAGGCNFPVNPMAPDSKKKFYGGIYAVENDGTAFVTRRIGSLPQPMAYGACVPTPQGLVFAGGTDANGTPMGYAGILILDQKGNATVESLPSLPVAVDNIGGAYADGTVFVVGGNVDGTPSNRVYSLDMHQPSRGWKELEPFPGNPRVQPVVATSKDAKGNQALYLWGGFAGRTPHREPSLNTDGLKYDIDKNKWERLAPPTDAAGHEISTGGGAATTLPDGRIAVIGGVNKDIFLSALQNQAPDYLSHPIEWYRFNQDVLVFDPTTEVWRTVATTPEAARAGAGLVATDNGDLIVIGGELKPRIRSAEVAKIKID